MLIPPIDRSGNLAISLPRLAAALGEKRVSDATWSLPETLLANMLVIKLTKAKALVFSMAVCGSGPPGISGASLATLSTHFLDSSLAGPFQMMRHISVTPNLGIGTNPGITWNISGKSLSTVRRVLRLANNVAAACLDLMSQTK